MAEDKDSLLDLKSELSALSTDLGDGVPEEEADISGEMMDLKNRMDKSDQEMRAMTEAMKSTLLDVRALMQDMDNPFNMLREMGVDKLVSKAVETVEDEVMKQKRLEAKKRMAGDVERPAAIVTHYGGAVPPSMAYPASAPSAPSPQAGIPMGFKNSQSSPQSPTQADTMTPSQPPVNGYPDASPEMSKPVPQPQTGASSSLERDLNSIMKRVSVTEQAVPLILSRISRTEEAVEELTDSVNELVAGLKGARPWGERASRHKPSHYNKLGINELKTPENSGEVYYEAYISLVADYLVLRFGEKGSEEILLEGMYKEWASPKVVRDIMDHISTSAKTMDTRGNSPSVGLGTLNSDLEDKILLTSLLRNLDRPAAEWTEPTHLFLLLALVTRARENKLNRA
ncbi:hypothetical protein KAT55_00790 [Candidatus Bathyarchaeota archaeon]|nr:hypothetical protein [Candidatus Bathyarchaeota archaeon]